MDDTLSRRTVVKATAAAVASGVTTLPNIALGYAQEPVPGPTNMSPAVQKAWESYLDTLEQTRRFLYTRTFSERPAIQNSAAEVMMQLQAVAYAWVIAPRVDYPRFYVHTMFEPMVGTWGATAPDFRYRAAFIDGGQTYRIWGKRSRSVFLDIQLGSWFGALDFEEYKKLPTSAYPVDQMHLEPDGSFEIIASPEYHAGNWIKLDRKQDRMMLYVREAFYDWANEQPSLLRIERLGSLPARPLLDDEPQVVRRLEQASRCVTFMAGLLSTSIFDWALKIANGRFNVFGVPDNPDYLAGNKAAFYSIMAYDMASDEALIMEMDRPTSKYWGIMLGDRYFRQTDYTYHQSSLNGHQTRIDGDGKVRYVLSSKDPGVPNWLDPVDNHPVGIVQLRQYFQVKAVAPPTVKKVSFEDIRRNLPADTPLVSPTERKMQLHDRSWAMLGLFEY
jgi:hypothetical protein